MSTDDEFDYKTADAYAIDTRAKLLVREVPRVYAPSAATASTIPSPQSKGTYGAYVEEYFGIPPNNIDGPDFPAARVELKTVPIEYSKGGAPRAAERTKAGSLDPFEVLSNSWPESRAHRKLAHVLFVFYHRLERGEAYEDMPVLATCLWELAKNPEDNKLWSSDYDIVRALIADGRAHQLSSSLTKSLHAHTSGTGRLRSQPNSPEPMKQRSLGVKPPFTTRLVTALLGKLDHLDPNLRDLAGEEFELALLDRLAKWKGMPVKAIRESFNVKKSTRKDQVAFVVTRALGDKQSKYAIEELSRNGISVKTVPLSPDGVPQESMSFPSFVPLDFNPDEEFEDSQFADQIQRLLIVPHTGKRKVDTDERRLETPFFWSPSRSDLTVISEEWKKFRDLIVNGSIDILPKESDTEFIHVRPKGRDAKDKIEAPGSKVFQRSCFWLNRKYVTRILQRDRTYEEAL